MSASVPSHFDILEIRDPADRERELLVRLAAQVAHAKAQAPAYAKMLAGIEPASITSRAALATLPVTRKSELLALPQAQALRDPVYSIHRVGAQHASDASLNPCGQRLPLLCDFPPPRAARGFFIDPFDRGAAVVRGQRFAAGRALWGGIIQGSGRMMDAQTIRCRQERVKRIRP